MVVALFKGLLSLVDPFSLNTPSLSLGLIRSRFLLILRHRQSSHLLYSSFKFEYVSVME